MAGDRPTLQLVDGFPPEPAHGDLGALTSLPGPARFLEALFAALADTDVSRSACRLAGEEGDGGMTVQRFVCGSDAAGYRQTETRAHEPGDEPVHVEVETFGLPGISITWSWALDHQGQLGHCGYRHGALAARFAAPADRERFEEIWTATFGYRPRFSGPCDGAR